MSKSRSLAAITGLAFVLGFAFLGAAHDPEEEGDEFEPPQIQGGETLSPPEPGRPISMPIEASAIELTFRGEGSGAVEWSGDVRIRNGRLLNIAPARGTTNAQINGSRFQLRKAAAAAAKKKKQQTVQSVGLRLVIDGQPASVIEVETDRGRFKIELDELLASPRTSHLNGLVEARRHEISALLTGRDTEDDDPASAVGPDGVTWAAFVEYQPENPRLTAPVPAEDFDKTLVPGKNGDRIRLTKFDGRAWSPPINVTAAGLDVWRPSVVVASNGDVWTFWSQQFDGDWDIFGRRYSPKTDKWGPIDRVVKSPGPDIHVVSAVDRQGAIWLAWQGWAGTNFDIRVTSLAAEAAAWTKPREISESPANDWSPAIAADPRVGVHVAWDTYDRGNYDVRVQRLGVPGETGRITVIADSPRFEARPSLACDPAGRLWVAFEEGDEEWGKDYSTKEFQKVGFDRNKGRPLYDKRTIRVVCLADGRLLTAPGSLEDSFGALPLNKSLPRLKFDVWGGLWMLFRHHINPNGAGEAWASFAVRHNGKDWSEPRRIPNSENLLDARPGITPHGGGILAVYSGDARANTQSRDQHDVFAAFLRPRNPSHNDRPVDLQAEAPLAKRHVPVVHPEEDADVKRMRNYRVLHKGKPLRLLRGEFHRHTEYSSHNEQDGMLEDAWRYGLDAGRLDWMGDGDHDNGFGFEYMWWRIQKITDLYQVAPVFTAAQTYERSVVFPNGHRNVIMPRRGIRPLPRSVLEGTEKDGTPDTKLLYAYLKHFGGICASHTSGTNMGTDWRDNDPDVEPIVEIYQGHRHNYEHFGAPRSATEETHIGGYQPSGVVWNAFAKGYRFGFQSSSDHVSTHMSYAVALVEDASRQGLIDAFKKRHCYAATDNIIAIVRSGEHLMGDAFDTTARPRFQVEVRGSDVVRKLHVVRDNKYALTLEPNRKDVVFEYVDDDKSIKPGETHMYYVRVEQADGNLAWCSPMWITLKSPK